jgi:predicted DNA-binding WGR domain protein
MRRFEFSDSTSNKFWEVEVKGKTLNINFGKIGTKGQSKPKDFATPEKAKAEMEKLIKEKTGKGYVEVGGKAATKAEKSLYPEIKRLKEAGATLIRTVFEGVGDDGCFFSTVYKNNEILAISNQLDCYNGDIGRIYANNNMELPTGDAWGCTSILIIELASGKCSIGGGFADRQNELFENLVWEGVEEIKATILITKEEDEEDDDYSISTLTLEKKIEIKPCSNLPKGKKLLNNKAENALKWWVNCEGQTSIGGETPFFEELASDYKVNSFDLTINTKKKVMEIKAGKKKINIKLSGIKTKKFNIDI